MVLNRIPVILFCLGLLLPGGGNRLQAAGGVPSLHTQRIMVPARPTIYACQGELNQIRNLQHSVELQSEITTARAGGEVAIHWRRGNLPRQRLPVYLVISTKSPVRFRGEGFYALLPGARAAFDIPYFKNTTRVIVPLYGRDVPESGEIKIIPLLAQALELEWSVVGVTPRCRHSHASASRKIRISVRPGAAKLVVDDPFSLKTPKERITSPDRTRIIEVFDSHFRVVDAKTDSLVGTYEGKVPRFSPTGRFFAAYYESGTADYRLFDTIDGRLIISDLKDFVWGNHDSFIFDDHMGGGILHIRLPLLDGRNTHRPAFSRGTYSTPRMACSACTSWDVLSAKLDLENNVFIAWRKSENDSISRSVYIRSLTSNRDFVSQKGSYRAANQEAAAFVGKLSQVVMLRFPVKWEVSGGVQITNYRPKDASDSDHEYYKKRQHFLIPPLFLRSSSTKTVVANLKGKMRSLSWRGLSRVAAIQNHRNALERLKSLGLRFSEGEKLHAIWPAAQYYDDYERIFILQQGRYEAYQKVNKQVNFSKVEIIRNFIYNDPRLRRILKENYWNWRGKDEKQYCRSYDEPAKYGVFDLSEISGWKNADGRQLLLFTYSCRADGARGGMGPSFYRVLVDRRLAAGYQEIPYIGGKNQRLVYKRFLYSWSKWHVSIFDLKEMKNIIALGKEKDTLNPEEEKDFGKDIPDAALVEQFLLTDDVRHLVQINSNGDFYVHRIADKRIVLQGRYEDDEIVVWTPDGHYDATAEGAFFARLSFAGRSGQYSFQQFDRRLRVPGLVRKVLAGEVITGVGWQDVSAPPDMDVRLRGKIGGHIEGSVSVQTDSPSSTTVNIFQDGLLTDRLVPVPDGKLEINVKRLPGTRWVAALAVDRQGLVSQPMGGDLGPDSSGDRVRLHYLTVGIDKYEHIADLGFGKSDALRFARSLDAAAGNVYRLGERNALVDSAATKTAIMTKARHIAERAMLGDTIVFSFAGHGLRDKARNFYLGTSATNPRDIAGTALRWSDLASIFAKSKARVAVFLDACHSGAAGTKTSIFATNDQMTSGLLAGIPSGLVVFSASRGRETSEESAASRGGVFTAALTAAINHDRLSFDTNRNGAIEISELYYGVKKRVVSQTNGRQTPWLARNQMVGDFALF